MKERKVCLLAALAVICSLSSGQLIKEDRGAFYKNCFTYSKTQKGSTSEVSLPAYEACEFTVATPTKGDLSLKLKVTYTGPVNAIMYDCPPKKYCSTSSVISANDYALQGTNQEQHYSTVLLSNLNSASTSKFSVTVIYQTASNGLGSAIGKMAVLVALLGLYL